MTIDSHVHDRGWKESYKENPKHALEVARDVGLDAIFTMPNTTPPILDEEKVIERLQLVREADVPEVLYGIWMGTKADKEQIKRAINVQRKYFPKVVGIKVFLDHSTNNMGITRMEDQYMVQETFAQEGYEGMQGYHAEKESARHPDIWKPITLPVSHCLARPEESEVESIKDLIAMAKAAKNKGKIHVLHTSTHKGVMLIKEAREKDGLDITCSTCPHYLAYDWTQMLQPRGNRWKMNPALREPGTPQLLFEDLKNEDILWIETDHAPHGDLLSGNLDEKDKEPFLSGIPGLAWWPLFRECLRYNAFSNYKIEKVTHYNIVDRFGIDIPNRNQFRRDRRADYPYNPYEPLEQRLSSYK
jgi:dihydroorotase